MIPAPMLPWVLLTGALVVVLLVGEWRRISSLKAVAKPLASAGFVAAAIAQSRAAAGGQAEHALSSGYGRLIVAALVLSWFGDVALLSRRSAPFLAGLASFLVAHLVFAAAFVVYGQHFAWSGAALCVLAVPALVIQRWLAPNLKPSMRLPVTAYVAAITGMLALAAGTVAAGGHPSILTGAIAFYLSDLAVARDRFVAPGFINRAWGLPLYYFAQLCLAWSVSAGPALA